MYYLFEESDSLSTPIECFVFDTAYESFPVRPHWHYFAEIIYILEGTAEICTEQKTYIMSEGDMILFHPKAIHSVCAVNTDPLKYDVLKFDINYISISSSYTPKLRSIFKSAAENGMPVCFRAADTAEMECGKTISDCVCEYQGQRYGYSEILRAEIYRLLMKITRSWLAKGFSIDSRVYAEDGQYSIESVTEYIDKSIKDNLQVADIAKSCGLSYSCFAKKFRSLYGKSCKEYIEAMRIIKVEDFLLFTDFDLNYISQETGFSDCSHMIKSFRQCHDCTPKQFRLKKRKET